VDAKVKDVLGLDLATTTGWARGEVGGIPRCGSQTFGTTGASSNAVFGHALKFFSAMLGTEPKPDLIVVEQMLPPDAMRGATNKATRDRLAGLHGILRGVAFCRGLYEVHEVSVLAVRRHFLGFQNAKKHDVFDRCRKMGWSVSNTDEADAAALWHFSCSLLKPELAIETSPLFGVRGVTVSAR